MPKKTFVATFAGKRIVVESTWFSGAKLYFDGCLLDGCDSLLAWPDELLMAGKITVFGNVHLVTVRFHGMFTIGFKVFVDGQLIDTFVAQRGVRNGEAITSDGNGWLSLPNRRAAAENLPEESLASCMDDGARMEVIGPR